jgi:hypothetical protein
MAVPWWEEGGPDNDDNRRPSGPRPTLGPTQERRRQEALDRGEPDPYAPKPTSTPKPTNTPKPTSTPKPTQTPKPTSTPKPPTPVPSATPSKTPTTAPSPTPSKTPTPVPPTRTPGPTGPGSRGGAIEIRTTAPKGMPPDRWQRIKAAVYADPLLLEALEAQDLQRPLTPEQREAILEANALINSEVRRWEAGLPFDEGEPATTATPEATPGVPDLGPPTAAGQERPSDLLTIEDAFGNQFTMTRSQYDAEDPSYRETLTVVNAEGQTMPVEPPFRGDASAGGAADLPPETVTAAAPPTPAVPPPATRPLPPDPTVPNLAPPREQERPPAIAASPKPAPPKPAPVVPEPKPVDIWDRGGREIRQGSLRGAIERAGGPATSNAASRVTREIGEVVEKGGYQGDTGGWRTLAQQSAAAWRKQYEEDPNSLHPDERKAYERDQEALEKTILNADSPFRRYRESWIGAYRAGELVPEADPFDEDVRAYGGKSPRRAPEQGRVVPDAVPRGGRTSTPLFTTDTPEGDGWETLTDEAVPELAPTVEPAAPDIGPPDEVWAEEEGGNDEVFYEEPSVEEFSDEVWAQPEEDFFEEWEDEDVYA